MVIGGLERYNRGEFFEAHEELETAWREERGPVRELYRGILQIAVAYVHLERGNFVGATTMLARAWVWLKPFLDYAQECTRGTCCGIDLAGLFASSKRVEEEILRLGPEKMRWLNRGLIEPIRYTTQEKTE